jgi:DNA primase
VTDSELFLVGGREVAISSPHKVLFPELKYTKLDLARYYLAVADGALRGAGGRPNMLVRYPNGIAGEFFYQKRAPASRPPWIEVVSLRFPSGRSADEVVPRDAAALVWLANLACLELHPHPVRADDLDHPDELRIDLDPQPGVVASGGGEEFPCLLASKAARGLHRHLSSRASRCHGADRRYDRRNRRHDQFPRTVAA